MRDRNLVPKHSVSAFIKLFDKIANTVGSREEAARKVGLNSGHIENIRQGNTNLSQSAAKKIINVYKELKETA